MNVRWLSGYEVVKLCQVSLNEILCALKKGLVAYDGYGVERSVPWGEIEVNHKNKERVFNVVQISMYKTEDVESLFGTINLQNASIVNVPMESKHNNRNKQGDAEEKQELGRLRLEKHKWPLRVKAAVLAGIHAGTSEGKITRTSIRDYWAENDLPLMDITDATLEEIWNALPLQKKSTGGRPAKGLG